jgi:site-specific DNA-methyltransferase (adenine-specific)
MITIYNADNMTVMPCLTKVFTLVYADMIFENLNLDWIDLSLNLLEDNGVFIVQTDYHSVAQVKLYLDDRKLFFVNWIVTHENWGGRSKRCFGRKHDDILIYAKGEDYKFYPERVLIPKVTAGTAFDKKGTGTQIPTDNWSDLGNFSTVAKERAKLDGHNVQWQKSLKLMNRLLLPFTDVEDYVLDPFLGSGTTAVWCRNNNRNCVGIEYNKTLADIATNRVLTNPGTVLY